MAIDSAPEAASGASELRRGTRSRAGNAMTRGREATLAGAVLAVTKYGARKATMGDIAMLAGIAKATLYNHFRTRDDVYLAAVAAEVDAIAAAATAKRADGLDAVFAEAARLVANHPALRRIARDEPATLAALAAPGESTSWNAARAHIGAALLAAGVDASTDSVDLVSRYFASLLSEPSTDAQRRATTALLAQALAVAQAPAPVGSCDTNT